MSVYTVTIEACDSERRRWQVMHSEELVTMDTPEEVATGTARHQTVATGDGWRVRVYVDPEHASLLAQSYPQDLPDWWALS